MAGGGFEYSFGFIVFVVVAALVFDFINGFHDAANSIATVVSTRVLRPHWAVVWAAFFNFVAFLFFGLHVANTIGKDVIDPTIVDPVLVFSALIGAIVWNILTWWFGIPSSSSHALIGGLAGAGVAKAGTGHPATERPVQDHGVDRAFAAARLRPGVPTDARVSLLLFRSTPRQVDRWFRRLQLVSAALYSLGHGGNDAQKTMGIIGVLLFSTGAAAARPSTCPSGS